MKKILMLSFFCLLGCGEKQDNSSQQDKGNTTQSKEKEESKMSNKDTKKSIT